MALEIIVSHPAKFGLPNPVSVTIEEPLPHEGKIYSEPDITLNLKSEDVHIVEYKRARSVFLLRKAKKQLTKTRQWYSQYRSHIPQEKIHTHIIFGDNPKYRRLLDGI